MMRRMLSWVALALKFACSSESESSPDPEPTPVEGSAGADVEAAPVEDPAAEELTHADAMALLQAAQIPVESIAGQDCMPPGAELTVAALVEESAASAQEQSTECTAGADGQTCTTRFLNNSGNEDEEFAVHLGYRVEGGAIVEWQSCLFAG